MKTLEERLWPKVQKTDTCWLWLGAKTEKGYGTIDIGGRKNKKKITSHRIACLVAGLNIKNRVARHECNNKLCVRVAKGHVQIGTQKQNMRDRELAGNTLKGTRSPNACFTKEQVKEIIKLWNTGEYSQRSLAKMFNSGKSTIQALVSGISSYYKEVDILLKRRTRSHAASGKRNPAYKHGLYVGNKDQKGEVL